MVFEKNLSNLDRTVRGFIGVSLSVFVFWNGGLLEDQILQWLLGVFGALNLVSLATGWCPVYQLAGLSSRYSDES